MRFFTQIYFVTVVIIASVSQVWADFRCAEQPEVVVVSAAKEEVVKICKTAKQAVDFLATMNLNPKRDITIEIVDKSIQSHGYVAYGSYDRRIDRIKLMSLVSIMESSEKPQMYGEPFDAVHYAGAIAHEIAHAVVEHNTTEKPLSTAPQEYLAHSTQLAVMPESRRKEILARMDVEPWLSGDAISDVYMAIYPGRFASKSYQHLTSIDNPYEFVDTLLNAKWFYVYVP